MGSSQILQWRKFEFFNVQEGADNGVLETLIKAGGTVTCVCGGRGLVFSGDLAGFVHCLARTLHSPVPSFPAHDAPVSWLWAADSASLLITMAHPGSSSCSEIKVWAPDRLQADQPVLLRLLRPDPRPPQPRGAPALVAGPPPPRVTAVAVHPNLNLLALGFGTGAIMLYRGDLGKERERGSTCRVLVTLTAPITNLHFHVSAHTYTAVPSSSTPSKARKGHDATNTKLPSVNVQTTLLLVTTTDNVYYINCTNREKEKTVEMDSVGCPSGCSALADGRGDQLFVMAREDALYSYSREGRAGCYAFPGPKHHLHCYRGYALVLATQADAAAAANSGGRSGLKYTCNVYDLSNKVIALTCNLAGPLVGLVGEWGGLYGVYGATTASGGGGLQPASMVHFREKDLHTKMEILFRKNQYDIAVSLAKGQSVSGEGVAEILKQYGDWLYSKGDLVMAVQQYIKTIPHLEPSYVIKKFLSSEHMSLLAEYLEALHNLNLHSPDHSSLLLNCYTRHKHDDRIHSFIQKHSEQVTQAKKFKESQMRDSSGVNSRQTAGSSATDAVSARNNFNSGLLHKSVSSCSSTGSSSNFSAGDVEVLVGVCREGGFHEEALKLTALHQLHALHLDILCNDTKQFREAVQYIRSLAFSSACEQMVLYGGVLARGCPDETLELLIELATDYTPDNTPLVGEAPLDSYLSSKEPEYAAPEMFESVVCGDSLLAIRYIEGVTKRQAQLGRGQAAPRLYEMLLAEYLHQLNAAEEGVVREAWERKVRTIISERRYPVDPSLACLLCDRHNYPQGKLLIWHHHHMYGEILQYHMDTGDEAAMVSVCEANSEGNRGLWLTALRYITSPQQQRARDTVALQTVLDKIDEYSLLPPMEVIDLLSACPPITLGQVRAYLTRLADREEEATSSQRHVVQDYVTKSDAIRQQIEAIQSNGLVFTESKCDACQKDLEFPTVHFFCKHSFHQHCFASYCSSSEDECPVCLPRHNDIRDALKHQASDRANVVSFGQPASSGGGEGGPLSSADDCEDVFTQLSEYLAKGLFTDYNAALALQTAHQHTPAAKAARRQKATAAAAALETSQASPAATESRLRLHEARPQQAVLGSGASEGRLRQAQSRGAASLQVFNNAEGRVRGQEIAKGTIGGITDSTGSEGRVRQQQQSRAMSTASEGRVRAGVASSVTIPQAEARMRTTQSRKFGGQGLRSKDSSPAAVGAGRSPYDRPSTLHDQVTVSGPNSLPVRASKQQLQHKGRHAEATESISASISNARPATKGAAPEDNPFEAEAANPFGDDFETEDIDNNPFADDAEDEKNPFKDDSKNDPFAAEDDYDKNLNPFGE